MQRPAAGKARRLDEQHITALAGDGQTQAGAGTAGPGRDLLVAEPRGLEPHGHRLRSHLPGQRKPLGPQPRRPAAEPVDGVVEEAHARFVRVAPDQELEGGRRERQLTGGQPVLPAPPRGQVHGRDPLLLRVGVAGQRQRFQPLPQQRRDAPGVGRDSDEQHAAQVQRQPGVAIAEAVVARRVERAEQRSGRRLAQPVELAEDDQGVVAGPARQGAELPQSVDEAPRPRVRRGAGRRRECPPASRRRPATPGRTGGREPRPRPGRKPSCPCPPARRGTGPRPRRRPRRPCPSPRRPDGPPGSPAPGPSPARGRRVPGQAPAAAAPARRDAPSTDATALAPSPRSTPAPRTPRGPPDGAPRPAPAPARAHHARRRAARRTGGGPRTSATL